MVKTKRKPIAELRKDLVMTQEDVNEVADDNLRYLMAQTANAGFSVASDYAFKCVCCESIGLDYSHYKLIKESVGPLCFSRKTDISKITASNRNGIIPLKDLEFKPEFSSHLNFSKDGLVCDHCNDTVYSNN